MSDGLNDHRRQVIERGIRYLESEPDHEEVVSAFIVRSRPGTATREEQIIATYAGIGMATLHEREENKAAPAEAGESGGEA